VNALTWWPSDDTLPQWDALALMRAAGLEPDPWQISVATTPGDQLLLCHRQAGKSTIVAALALADALAHADAVILLVSRSMRQAQELQRKVRHFYNLTRPLTLLKDTEHGIELSNHSRILSLPASEETIVGFSAVTRLILDEAARIPDGTYYALRPMLAMSQGSLLALSSPFGKRGWFWEAYEGNAEETPTLDLATIERLLADLDFPVGEPSAPGLTAPARDERRYQWTKTFLPATHNPRLSRAFLAHERQSIPALYFEQEWNCKFVDLGEMVFRWDDLQAMLSDEVHPLFDATGKRVDVDVMRSDIHPLTLGNGVWGLQQ
jgi:hypothetical protein